jgi:hypothetical protein
MRTLRINDRLLLESQSLATSAAVSILIKVRKRLWTVVTARFRFAVFWFGYVRMLIIYSFLMERLILLAAAQGTFVVSAEPRIDRIELFGTNAITVHFNTEANKTYSLQFVDSLSCGTNLPFCGSIGALPQISRSRTITPNFPFSNHYVIVDTRTNAHRFYRLKVTD